MKLTTDQRRIEQDVRNTNKALRRFSVLSKKDIVPETRHSARRVAGNLAFQTQPFGNSESAKRAADRAVSRDVHRVFSTPGKMYEQIEEKEGTSLAQQFYYVAKQGKLAAVRKILSQVGLSLPVAQNPKRDYHRGRRNRRGRVGRGAPEQLVLGGKAGVSLQRYIAKIQKRVGWAASGWSACAARLGGTRGIVKWKKRGLKGPGTVYSTGGDTRPTHYLMNEAPYIRNILKPAQIQAALRREDLILRKQTDIILKKSARRSGLKVI